MKTFRDWAAPSRSPPSSRPPLCMLIIELNFVGACNLALRNKYLPRLQRERAREGGKERASISSCLVAT